VAYTAPSRLLVVGLGSSGQAAIRLAAKDGSAVAVTDLRPAAELAEILQELPPVEAVFAGSHPLDCLDGVELVVTSPGVPGEAPLLQEARRRRIPVLSEVEYAWLHRPGAPLAAVTGSNGKSTVTTLIAEMLRHEGISVAAGGNLGPPASELILEGGWDSWVLEISSFQAEVLTAMAPRAALLLNLSQDHLERHPDMDSYLAAKLRLVAHQGSDDLAVLNADDPAVAAAITPGRRQLFSLEGRADAWSDGEQLYLGDATLLPVSSLGLAGRHNVANALAAALAARELGAGRRAMIRALESFRGLPHRHMLVAERDGIRWVDDSKATNVGATLAALSGYRDGSVLLILGGLGKGQDFSPLAPVVARVARAVYLIGRDAGLIARALEGAAPLELCGTLEAAVERAGRDARSGHTVLLAPACASFDQFSGYAERGELFSILVRREVVPCR